MTYDDWKLDTPDDDDNECWHCGAPCNGAYCSNACREYDTE